MTIQLPQDLEEQVSVLAETGRYANKNALLQDAILTLLASRPDLREEVACARYQRGSISLGRAAEQSGLTVEELKEALARRGVYRQSQASLDETTEMADRAIELAGRTRV